MVWKIILLILAVIGIFFFLSKLLDYIYETFIESGDFKTADRAYKIQQHVHGMARTILKRGEETAALNQASKNFDWKLFTIRLLLEGSNRVLDSVGPEKKLDGKLKKKIAETIDKLEQARRRAEEVGSEEAYDLMIECLNEMEKITQGKSAYENPVDLLKALQGYREAAEQVLDIESVGGKAPSSKTYYEVLGVMRDVSPAEIKKTYRDLAKDFHPDKLNNVNDRLRKLAEEQLREINEAYEVLSDPEKRKDYDQTLS